MIFAWEDLSAMAQKDLASARDRLTDMLRNYQSFKQCPVILVFDAYIEKLSYELGKKHRVRVATSDGLEQVIILGHGCLRVPARIFRQEVDQVAAEIRKYLSDPGT